MGEKLDIKPTTCVDLRTLLLGSVDFLADFAVRFCAGFFSIISFYFLFFFFS